MNITGVIHVGAHIGQEYEIYRNISTVKNIVFFEPNKKAFDILKEKTKDDPDVFCINKALGPYSCEAFLNLSTGNEGNSNSLLEPDLHKTQYKEVIFEGKEKVKVEPLDKFEPGKQLNFLNIDVQGAELTVLLGATHALSNNVRYVLTEFNTDNLYKNCAKIEDLDYFLGKYGFKRVETEYAHSDRPDLNISNWGDALYIK